MNKKFLFISIMLFIVGYALPNYAQEQDTTLTDLSISKGLSEYVAPSVFSISGEAGAEGELYSTSRAVKRRPNLTGRLYFRPTLTFLKNFSIAFDLSVSTDGSSARQQINRFALHPNWGWGKAHLGDFNYKFSSYSLNGVNIRGGGIEINPGLFILELIGGQTQRAVSTTPYSSMYARYMGAVRLGIGRKHKSFFTLNFLGARDDIKSLKASLFVPNSGSGNPQIGITPQENIVVGANTDLRFAGNMFHLKGEFDASLFTNDLYSDKADIEGIPTFLDKIFKIRNSTHLDFAYKGQLSFNTNVMNGNIKYSVINPGYNSLGMTNIISDKRRIGGMLGFRLFNNMMMFQLRYDRQNDNLLKQKLYTLTRQTYGVNFTLRPLRSVSLMVNALKNDMTNDAANDTMKVDNKILSINANMIFQFVMLNLNNSLVLGYTNQLTESFTFVSPDLNKITVNNFILNWNILLSSSWSVAPGFTMVILKNVDGSTNQTITGNLRITNRAIRGRWKNSLNATYSKSDFVNVVQLNWISDFRLTSSDIIKLKVRYSITNYPDGRFANFWENIASLNIIHRL